jgi:hypothetical protein
MQLQSDVGLSANLAPPPNIAMDSQVRPAPAPQRIAFHPSVSVAPASPRPSERRREAGGAGSGVLAGGAGGFIYDRLTPRK